MQSAGLSAHSLKNLEDLQAFPILEKSDIQEHFLRMRANNYSNNKIIANHTGGSTGEPLHLYLNPDRRCQREAGTWRHNSWAGARIGDKIAYIWGAPDDIPSQSLKASLRNIVIDRSIYINTNNINEEKILRFNEALKKFKPTTIIAYAKSAALIARYLSQCGADIYQPKSIITSAETLSATDRGTIEAAFGTKVFDRYGCREMSIIASECEYRDGYHTMAECLIVESLRPDGTPASPGEIGFLVVTVLYNYAMPLIRYRIGDLGALRQAPCPCGRAMPMIESIKGRDTDFLIGTDGQLVSGIYVATYLIGQFSQLGKIQILQSEAGDITYKVTNSPRSEDVEHLKKATNDLLGVGFNVKLEHVNSIHPSASGKTLLCQSSYTANFFKSSGAQQSSGSRL